MRVNVQLINAQTDSHLWAETYDRKLIDIFQVESEVATEIAAALRAKLDPEEYALMKKHPEYGWAVLRMLPGFERAALDILHHHENFDGTGYPAGLKSSEIPIVSRIVSVIDAFDAMVSSRPYRTGLPFEEAVRRLTVAAGTQFDPVVVKCFLTFAQAEMPTVFAAAGTSVASAL